MNRGCSWYMAMWGIVVTCIVATIAAFTRIDAEPQGAGAKATAPVEQTYRAPDKPLDARIKADKITTSEPPPLPAHVATPVAPQHRMATDASEVPVSDAHWQKAREAIARGVAFLKSRQAEDGSFAQGATAATTTQPDQKSPVTVAITALAIKALVQADGTILNDPRFNKGVDFLLAAQQADGSFDSSNMANYVTSSAVSAVASLDQGARHRDDLAGGVQALVTTQWDQEEGLDPKQDWFGGAGYGRSGRPDLSNTQMMLDALYDSGMSPDEPAFQRALAFASRCQNHKATNASEWAGDDGGFIYTPANGGESMASEVAGEGRMGEKLPEGAARSLRSYGSMTYAGFKSMLYAGLTADDERVKAALEWIGKHFTFEENPGLGQQGLYYYYHTMARALYVAGQPTIVDSQGVQHNWREELIDAIASRQAPDGSWANDADRWMEGDPVLVTSYCLLALEEALKPTTAATKGEDR